MALQLTWSPAARLDLHDIFEYIAEDDPAAAAEFVQSVLQAVERLSDFPQSGRLVPEFGDPLIREVIRRPCRIVYRVNQAVSTVEIVRVWHSRRGISELPSSQQRRAW
jgi:plasmid stabilization system protein ParE